MNILGIDEAGRGPVIGPMVMSAYLMNSEEENTLKEMGIKDSKKIAPKKREKIFSLLKEKSHYTISLEPSEIDYFLLSTNINLNKLELITTVKLILKANKEHNIDKVIVDTPTKGVDKYKLELIEEIKKQSKTESISFEIICENKADDKYVSVGAASVIAKVTRDEKIKKITEEFGEIGSGYPSDVKTKDALEKMIESNNITFLKYVRKSWATYKNAKEKFKQANLF